MTEVMEPDETRPDPFGPTEAPPPSGPRLRRIRQMAWEAAAVLSAILVAFGLDAWWEQRIEIRDMIEALDAVAVELEKNLSHVDSAIALNRRQVQTAMDLAALRSADVASLSDEDVRRYAAFPNYEEVTLERGATTAFIEGGFLRAVEDVDLRTQVAGLAAVQDELDEELEGFRASADRVTQLSIQMLPLDDLGGVFDVGGSRSQLAVIAANPTARREIFGRAFLLSIYTDELSRVRDRLAESLETIRGGLE